QLAVLDAQAEAGAPPLRRARHGRRRQSRPEPGDLPLEGEEARAQVACATVDLHPGEKVIYQGHPSWRAILGFYLKGAAVGLGAGARAALLDSSAGLGVVTFVVVLAITIVVGFIKRVATVYTITDRRLNIKLGIVSRNVQETRLQRVQNVNFNQ